MKIETEYSLETLVITHKSRIPNLLLCMENLKPQRQVYACSNFDLENI
jgi:hypothetical protein